MTQIDPDQLDCFLLEDTVWIAAAPVGLPHYDFAFERFGVTADYAELYRRLIEVNDAGRFGGAAAPPNLPFVMLSRTRRATGSSRTAGSS